MTRTKIEWCDYTINPVKGLCPMACPYCYARAMYKRFKWNPYVRADWSAFNNIPTKPNRIFIGSTMELFGDWVKPEWMDEIFRKVNSYPQHTFLFLTKQPQNLIKFSPFPDNCWVGVSVTTLDLAREAIAAFAQIEARVKFASYEPCYDNVPCKHLLSLIDWLIIGAQTKPYRLPSISKVQEIVEAADKAGIPVFLKDNLLPLLASEINGKLAIESHNLWAFKYFKLRQEIPG